MKALISAFALFAFVAASTIPVTAMAEPHQTTHTKKKAAKKPAHHKVAHKKKGTNTSSKKMKKPSQA